MKKNKMDCAYDVIEREIQNLQAYRVPMTVKYYNRHGEGPDLSNKDYFSCPRCGRRLRNKQRDGFCGNCGQAIDWNYAKGEK